VEAVAAAAEGAALREDGRFKSLHHSPSTLRGEGRGEGERIEASFMKRPNIGTSRYLRRNQTDAEKKLWGVLRNRGIAGIKFRRQFPVDKFILDFYAPDIRLCIEADGGQHYTEEGKQHDAGRTTILADSGVQVLRFSDRDILSNIEGVCEMIQRAVESRTPPHHSPLPQGERK
jgi:very-short-patch-repair endonuclease